MAIIAVHGEPEKTTCHLGIGTGHVVNSLTYYFTFYY